MHFQMTSKIFLDESDDLAQVRRTGQEMAIRRGQSSKFKTAS